MFDGIYHDITTARIKAIINNQPQSIAIVGPQGIGKKYTSHNLAGYMLKVPWQTLLNNPYVLLIRKQDNKSFGIDNIRSLEHFLSRKVPGNKKINRIVILEDAHVFGIPAQNAMLKVIEEPPSGTVLLLTSNNLYGLLPTIRSRLQFINIHRPLETDIINYFTAAGNDPNVVKQSYLMGAGLPGLMEALISNTKHPMREAANLARSLLQKSIYERLLMVNDLAKDKANCQDILSLIQHMAQISLESSSGPIAKKWLRILKATYEASEQLQHNVQAKLCLTNLMFHLS